MQKKPSVTNEAKKVSSCKVLNNFTVLQSAKTRYSQTAYIKIPVILNSGPGRAIKYGMGNLPGYCVLYQSFAYCEHLPVSH